MVPHEGFENRPVVWILEWSKYVVGRLVTKFNPTCTISNSDLELAGGLLQIEVLSHTFDVREQALLSKTANICILF